MLVVLAILEYISMKYRTMGIIGTGVDFEISSDNGCLFVGCLHSWGTYKRMENKRAAIEIWR